MTLDERYDRTRKFVYRQRRRLPAVFVAAGSVALLFSTPFMICDGPVFGALCLACSCAGFWVRWQALAQTAYRRSRMKADPAAFAEPFPVEGIHSRVRYPLHAGGFLVWLGPVLFTGVGWFMVSASLAYALCVWLAISGEEALRLEKYGEPYRLAARCDRVLERGRCLRLAGSAQVSHGRSELAYSGGLDDCRGRGDSCFDIQCVVASFAMIGNFPAACRTPEGRVLQWSVRASICRFR